ncbi:MAG: DUF4836 family protein [Bacteroidetes bacterium]|nr:DUF4836 family protein [Bacteroidota bacterium]
MMTFIKRTLPLLFICLSFGLFAQKPVDHIPSDVSLAFSFHPEHLNEKVNLREFQQMGFYQMLIEQMGQMAPPSAREQITNAMADPQSIGLNDMGDAWVFSKFTADATYFAVAISLSNADAFGDFFKQMGGDNLKLEQQNGYSYFQPENDVAIGWNNGTLIIAGSDLKEDYWGYGIEEVPMEEESWEDYEMEEDEEMIEEDEDTLMDDTPEEEEFDYDAYYSEQNRRQMEETASWAKMLLERSFDKSIQSNSKFAKAKSNDSDFNFWMDYAALPFLEEGGGYGGMGMMGSMTSVLTGLYDGMYMNAGMNFDPGQINIDMDIFGNEQMLDWWKDSYKSRYNKKMFKYIDGSELLGYLHVNLDVEGLFEGYKEMFMPVVESFPGMGEMAAAGLDAIGIVIDEEALYELFSGDAVVAFTGMSEFTKTVTTYEYDENFNATEVEKEVKEFFPEFNFMAGYGNEENILKLVRLLEVTGLAQNLGNHYSISIPDVPGAFYLAMHDDILFFTNDTELIGSRLEDGFPKDRRMSKDQCKAMKKSASRFFWDIPNTISMVSSSGMPFGGAPGEFLNIGKQNFESLSVTSSSKIKDSASTTFTLQMADDETNALKQIMDLVNDMVMDMMGGESRS